jgi:Kef-type K+ transport system membrane component KefB
MPTADLGTQVIATLLVVLVVAVIFGRLADAVGQPRVVGEMVAGLLLGPVLLGGLSTDAPRYLFSPSALSVLDVLADIGLAFYMFVVGARMELKVRGNPIAGRAMQLSLSAFVFASLLGGGTAVAWRRELAVPGVGAGVLALTFGAALAITAFPTLARMLEDRADLGPNMRALLLLAAAVDDVVAWNLLAVLTAVAGGAHARILVTLVGIVALSVLALAVLHPALRRTVHCARRHGRFGPTQFAVVLLLVLAFAWASESIGVFAAFGSFLVGLALPTDATVERDLLQPVFAFTSTLLVPVYFALTGLRVVPSSLHWSIVVPLVALLAAAFLGKYLSSALTVRWWGVPWRPALEVGAFMNARGLMLLVFANAGLQAGALSQSGFVVLVVIGLVTTAATAPLCRLVRGRIPAADGAGRRVTDIVHFATRRGAPERVVETGRAA